jgi:hypothetical protein
MGESVDVSAVRAGPATGFRIRALGMRHFIYEAALDTSSRFAAYDFLLLYGLHKFLSIRKASYHSRVRSLTLYRTGLKLAAPGKPHKRAAEFMDVA